MGDHTNFVKVFLFRLLYVLFLLKGKKDEFIFLVDKSLVDILSDKIDIISKYFPKPVKIEGIEQKKERKTKKRDEAVDKVLELFQGKIISYKEE